MTGRTTVSAFVLVGALTDSCTREPSTVPLIAAQTAVITAPPASFEGRLRIDAVATRVDVDGELLEWPPMARSGAAPSLEVGFATEDAMLYIAAKARGSESTRAEERIHVRLWFQLGGASGPPWDLWLTVPSARQGSGLATRASYSGAPESVSAARVQIVSRENGFDLEAAIPWDTFPPAERSRFGLRAGAGYEVAGKVVAGLAWPDGVVVPRPIEQELLTRLEPEAHRLWPQAARSWIDAGADFPYTAELMGDERLERIGRLGGRISVCSHERGCHERDYGAGARIEGIETHEILGGGKQDLVVRYWKPAAQADHLVLEVITFEPDGMLRPVFRHEVTVQMHCCGSEGNAPPYVRSEAKFAPSQIEIRAGKAWRLTQRQLTEPPLGGGIFPVVAPWDVPPIRRYVVRDRQLIEASD